MSDSKFKAGDKIRIVGYGAKIYMCKKDYPEHARALYKLMYSIEHSLMWGTEPAQDNIPTFDGDSKPAHILEESEDLYIVDMCPEVVGQEGTVGGSYFDLYGEGHSPEETERNKRMYSLSGIKGKLVWYQEEQLELIK